VIRDKRKIDPSGKPKTPDAETPVVEVGPDPMGQPPAPAPVPAETADEAKADEADAAAEAEGAEGTKPPLALGAELESLRSELDERLRDLQRITAEYANYRKRIERDRGLVAEQTIGTVIGALLPILDDLDRAREHDDLVGPFAAMAEQLNGALAKFGLTGFGEPGDAFDPTRHEAVAHQTSADVTEPTCISVMRRGYLLGDRLLRPALVAVADPE
jgi:molecular chaperone GrpE